MGRVSVGADVGSFAGFIARTQLCAVFPHGYEFSERHMPQSSITVMSNVRSIDYICVVVQWVECLWVRMLDVSQVLSPVLNCLQSFLTGMSSQSVICRILASL